MTARRSNSWSNRKTLRNLQYLENLERKKNMSRPIVDNLGFPMSGNNQQQQGPSLNPVLQMLWPVFAQTIHDLAAKDENPPDGLVECAWEIANRAFNKMGFEFVFPMGARIIPSPEVLQTNILNPEPED